MPSSSSTPPWPVVVVSPFDAFHELAVSLGLAQSDSKYLSSCTGEDIRNCHVISDDLPLSAAAYASALTIIDLNIPAELRSPRAGLAVLKKFAMPPQTYWVTGSAEVIGQLYNGGVTPVAAEIAREILKDLHGMTLSAETLAEYIDRALWPERNASIQTERLLLKILAAERDRRILLSDAAMGNGQRLAAGDAHSDPKVLRARSELPAV